MCGRERCRFRIPMRETEMTDNLNERERDED